MSLSDAAHALPHPVDLHVGQRIRSARKLLGVSQEALALQLGLTFQQIQKYERGANRVSASKLWMIAQVLGLEIGWFFDGLPRATPGGQDDGLPRATPGGQDDGGREITAPRPIDDPSAALGAADGGHDLARAYLELNPVGRRSLMTVAHAIRQATSAPGDCLAVQ